MPESLFATLLKRDFLVNFRKLLRTSFFIEHRGGGGGGGGGGERLKAPKVKRSTII